MRSSRGVKHPLAVYCPLQGLIDSMSSAVPPLLCVLSSSGLTGLPLTKHSRYRYQPVREPVRGGRRSEPQPIGPQDREMGR